MSKINQSEKLPSFFVKKEKIKESCKLKNLDVYSFL